MVLITDTGQEVTTGGTLDGVTIALVPIDARRMGFVAPEMAPGIHTLHVPGFNDVVLTFIAPRPIPDPRGYVERQLEASSAEFAAALTSSAAEVKPYYENAIAQVASLQDAVVSSTDDEVAIVAAMIDANPTLFARAPTVAPRFVAFDSFDLRAVNYIVDWAFVGASVALVVAAAAATPFSVLALGAAAVAFKGACANLRRDYPDDKLLQDIDRVIQTFANLQAHADAGLRFSEGAATELPLAGEFSEVQATNVDSADPNVRAVAEIAAATPGLVERVNTNIDMDAPPPRRPDPTVVTGPLPSGEVSFSTDRPEIVVRELAPPGQPSEIVIEASTCAQLPGSSISFTLTITAEDVSGVVGSKTFPASLSCSCGGRQCSLGESCIDCQGRRQCAPNGASCCGSTVIDSSKQCCSVTSPPTVQNLGEPCCASHILCAPGQTYVVKNQFVLSCCQLVTDALSCVTPYSRLTEAAGNVVYDWSCNPVTSSMRYICYNPEFDSQNRHECMP